LKILLPREITISVILVYSYAQKRISVKVYQVKKKLDNMGARNKNFNK
jgi:hypothetical protein